MLAIPMHRATLAPQSRLSLFLAGDAFSAARPGDSSVEVAS